MDVKKTIMIVAVLVMFVGGLQGNAYGVDPLPDDFPELIINQYGETAPGYLYGKLKSENPEVGEYFMILENSGTPVFYSKTQELGEPLCNGLFKYTVGVAGANKKYTWHVQDDAFNDVDTFQAGHGYLADSHDFQILPNGHALILIYDRQYIDMSKIVPGGHPRASINGTVIQELDFNKNVIFQWRSWDHIPITDSYQNHTEASFDCIHVNSIEYDVTDGNLILSGRSTSDIIKISRVTGEVIWRLCGKQNDFTFIDEHEENAPRYFKFQHDARRYGNGNLSLFDNGFNRNDKSRKYSRAVEYHLDEENMTATMVWEYRNDPDFGALNKGMVIRMDNGNSVVHWGGAAVAGDAPVLSEVDASGQLVYELWPAQEGVTVDGPVGQFDRIVWPIAGLATMVAQYELMDGNEYLFNNGDDVTGVELKVKEFDGEGYNEAYVTTEPLAPLFPEFIGKAPRVLPVRINIDQLDIYSMEAQVSLDAETFGFADSSGKFGFADPENLTIYFRQFKGQGLFIPLATNYNPVTKQLRATMTQFGEFIIGFPDLAEVANAPILLEPADEAAVNQELPVPFFWTPRGFARSYDIQVATDAEFMNLVVDESSLSEIRYIMDSVESDKTYYWRVRANNDGGTGEWSTRSFSTVAPMIEVTTPVAGEKLSRGLDSFILWEDNLNEDVVIELYKGDVLAQEIDTVSSTGVYEWEVDLALDAGCDYSIKVKSSVDETLFDNSEIFSIDVPAGDFDCNGCVSFDDLAVLAGEWLHVEDGLTADIQGDGKVDFVDVGILAESWMQSCD